MYQIDVLQGEFLHVGFHGDRGLLGYKTGEI